MLCAISLTEDSGAGSLFVGFGDGCYCRKKHGGGRNVVHSRYKRRYYDRNRHNHKTYKLNTSENVLHSENEPPFFDGE